ncbi:RabGAP/TBC [Choiromyces venosus 120613-1]|uniref:RabGAP/TBC n=1 Tax=Choiromyces venosus 120613-1 TaxID=1336337 RepID=A0A3N4IT63_9PEZI|nr:RabGAP/TBC [Choiromyces venosus 120613-1]
MRTLQETRKRWESLFKGHSSISALRAATTDGIQKSNGNGSTSTEGPCGGGLRSVCWKLFLLFPEFKPEAWSRTIRCERAAFEELKRVHVSPFEKAADFGEGVDPLAEVAENPWEQFRKDESLRKEIFQDIERCMPENTYFRDPTIQNSLLNTLFIYCKLNADVSYRQGMHEIVAIILWVVACDAISLATGADEKEESKEEEGGKLVADENVMIECLDHRFIEHDTFSLFQVVMRSAKAWYELGEEAPSSVKGRGRSENRASSPIVEKSKYIHEYLLMAVDPELAEHLKALDVLPQVFLIRWIRLLFGREFPFEELLEVWDALFAEDPNLQLVDHICVAMLLRVRWQLMEADYSTALTLVLRYPSPTAPDLPATFVADAIYIRDNPTFAGGKHIVVKYSNRAPTPPVQKPRAPKLSRKNSPLTSPTRFLQTGQLESIVQDVAKNMLSQGERWGVNRAVRDAVGDIKKNVQGFQHSQQQQWAAQESAREAELVRRSRELSKKLKVDDHRRKKLEKLLRLSIEELERDDLSSEQKKASLARLNHVRECLSDSTKSVDYTPPAVPSSNIPIITSVPTTAPSSPVVKSPISRRASSPSAIPTSTSTISQPTKKPTSTPPPPPAPAPPPKPQKVPTSPQGNFVKTSFKNNSDPDFLTHRPRASLAQSSFAWMLGDDPAAKTKTAFVSASTRKSGNSNSSSGGGGSGAGGGGGGGGGVDGLGDGIKVDATWTPDVDEGFDLERLRRKR